MNQKIGKKVVILDGGVFIGYHPVKRLKNKIIINPLGINLNCK
jgi:hypothetical protein